MTDAIEAFSILSGGGNIPAGFFLLSLVSEANVIMVGHETGRVVGNITAGHRHVVGAGNSR
jgi:hypothetical protein